MPGYFPKAVVFDVDGTLVDSERDGHRIAFNLAFEEFDLPFYWDEEQYGYWLGISGGKSRLRAFLSHQANSGFDQKDYENLIIDLHNKKTEIFQDLVSKGSIKARFGVLRLLEELQNNGIDLAIATTGSRSWVEELLAKEFKSIDFKVIVTGQDVKQTKPDPQVYRQVKQLLDLSIDQIIVIEDSAIGIQASKAVQLSTIAVANFYTIKENLTQADLVVDGFGDMLNKVSVLYDPLGINPNFINLDCMKKLLNFKLTN